MNDFNKYFSVYESVEPPPILSQNLTIDNDQDLNPISLYSSDVDTTDDVESPWKEPFGFVTQPISKKEKSTSSNVLDNVVSLARKYVGTKYSWGGSTPSTGFDCSGLIQYVYKKNGISLPRTTSELEKVGIEIPSLSEVQEGDLIFTPGSGSTGKHVKLVSRVEDGQIFTIEAKGKKDGIVETPLSITSNITHIRRVNNKSGNYIINYFMSKGLTKNQAKGIYGNLMQESGGNLHITSSDGHGSYGLAQWTGSRKQKLFSMYGYRPTMRQQLDFLWWELNNTHSDALTALKNTRTVSAATRVFMNQFERPDSRYANFNRRLKYANSIV